MNTNNQTVSPAAPTQADHGDGARQRLFPSEFWCPEGVQKAKALLAGLDEAQQQEWLRKAIRSKSSEKQVMATLMVNVGLVIPDEKTLSLLVKLDRWVLMSYVLDTNPGLISADKASEWLTLVDRWYEDMGDPGLAQWIVQLLLTAGADISRAEVLASDGCFEQENSHD